MYHYEIWDGKSPINGVSAEMVNSIYTPQGAMYVIYKDSTAFIIQPYSPRLEGKIPMTEKQARQYAQAAVDEYNALIEDDISGIEVEDDDYLE